MQIKNQELKLFQFLSKSSIAERNLVGKYFQFQEHLVIFTTFGRGDRDKLEQHHRCLLYPSNFIT